MAASKTRPAGNSRSTAKMVATGHANGKISSWLADCRRRRRAEVWFWLLWFCVFIPSSNRGFDPTSDHPFDGPDYRFDVRALPVRAGDHLGNRVLLFFVLRLNCLTCKQVRVLAIVRTPVSPKLVWFFPIGEPIAFFSQELRQKDISYVVFAEG